MVSQLTDKDHATGFPWVAACSLYVASFGLQLAFLPARFWDDWMTNFLYTGEETKQYWEEVGFLPIYGFIQSDVLGNFPPAIRLLQLLLHFLGGICFFWILRSLKLPSWFVTIASLTFLVLPINSARVSISMINYAISLFLFLLGWALLTATKGVSGRILSLLTFFVSFSTLTLLPMFLLPALHFSYLKRQQGADRRVVLLTFSGLIALPLLYWFVWRRLNPPVGEDLVAYFTPSASGIIRAGILVGFASVVVFLVYMFRHILNHEYFRFLALALGIFAIAIGASGYVASGRLVDLSEWLLNFVPETSEWNSRHQLLLGIGMSIGFAAIVGRPLSKLRKALLIAAFGTMVLLNMSFMQGYLLDYHKQEQTISALSQHPEILEWETIFVDDEATIFNARGRNFRSYEIQGMIKRAFSSTTQSALGLDVVPNLDCSSELPDGQVSIFTSSGRLRALLTLNPQIRVEVKRNPCSRD